MNCVFIIIMLVSHAIFLVAVQLLPTLLENLYTVPIVHYSIASLKSCCLIILIDGPKTQ